jgi:hypothetical protein
MKTLKNLSTDGTYSHGSIANSMKKRTAKGSTYCFDLTAATDRMPVEIQKSVISKLFSQEISDLWLDICVNRDFNLPRQGKFPRKSVRYAVGQPMGLLSSWATMALTHHMIVQYCAHLVGRKRFFKMYTIIGDDIAIFDKTVASKYLTVMDSLGIKINRNKSVVSEKQPYCGEIAKRLFISGIEVSPIPPDIIKAASKD